MSVTYGFYNSLDGDRKYNAEQFSSIFDNLITDGVFGHVGDKFVVKQSSGMVVTVGEGRAWFNSTWTLNDTELAITIDTANILLPRIDAVILEVNAEESVRENAIKVIKGEAASSPVRPTLINTQFVHQYPLAYIYVGANVSEITTANITNMVGSTDTPLVTGILQTISLNDLVAQWQAVLDDFVSDNTTAYNQWFATTQAAVDAWIETMEGNTEDWIEGYESDFLTWYDRMKGQLSQDAAGNLQLEIDALNLQDRNIIGRTTTFADDGSVHVVEESGAVTDVTFNADGSITEVYSAGTGTVSKTHTIRFNNDGSITEVIS